MELNKTENSQQDFPGVKYQNKKLDSKWDDLQDDLSVHFTENPSSKCINAEPELMVFPRVIQNSNVVETKREDLLDSSKMAENGNIAAAGECQISSILQELNLGYLELPMYLKQLLIYTGFDTIASLAQFKEDEDYDAIQNFAASELPDLLAESEKSMFYGIYARHVKLFKIPLGHRKLLNILIEYCKIYFKEQFSSDTPIKKIKTLNQNLHSANYTQPGSSDSDGVKERDNQDKEEDFKIIEPIKSVEKKSSAMLNLSKLSVELQNGTPLVILLLGEKSGHYLTVINIIKLVELVSSKIQQLCLK